MKTVLSPLEADLHIHAKLDDEPNDVGGLTAQELKEKFDQAGVTIQAYLNETHLPQVKKALEETAEEARAYADGKVVQVGAGDMAQAVYDPQGLGEDVYAYARERAEEAMAEARRFGYVAAGSCTGKSRDGVEGLVTLKSYADPRGFWDPVGKAFTAPEGAKAMAVTVGLKWGRQVFSTCGVEIRVNGSRVAGVSGPEDTTGNYIRENAVIGFKVSGGDRVQVALVSHNSTNEHAEVNAQYIRVEILL